MATITTSDGVRLHYLDDGDPAGPPVVLLAGFRAPATSWSPQWDALRGAGDQPRPPLARRVRLAPTALALLHDHATRDWRSVVTACDVPLLMVAARDSEFWPCEHATALAGGKVEAAVIGNCGHAVNIERPDEFNQLLLRFIG
jgi:pimeloyl-ACP methyl ester carboxylesterase